MFTGILSRFRFLYRLPGGSLRWLQSFLHRSLIHIVFQFPLSSPQQLSSETGWIFDDLMWDLVENQGPLLVLFIGVLYGVGLGYEELGEMH